MGVHQLQHLAHGDGVGRVGHHALDAQVVERHHHLERAGVEVVAHQHARLVAEDVVRGVAAAPHFGAVHHVVVEQGGRVDELDDGGRLDVVVARVAAGTGGQQHAQRAQPLATAADDVLGNLVDQHHVAREALDDDLVHPAQVVRDQRPHVFELHSRHEPPTKGRRMVPGGPGRGNGGKLLNA